MNICKRILNEFWDDIYKVMLEYYQRKIEIGLTVCEKDGRYFLSSEKHGFLKATWVGYCPNAKIVGFIHPHTYDLESGPDIATDLNHNLEFSCITYFYRTELFNYVPKFIFEPGIKCKIYTELSDEQKEKIYEIAKHMEDLYYYYESGDITKEQLIINYKKLVDIELPRYGVRIERCSIPYEKLKYLFK